MFKVTDAQFERFNDWMVKVSTAVISIPATWQVGADAFALVPAPWRYVLQGAGVALVEGVLLARWVRLERRKADELADKIADTLAVWVMYAALIVVAVLHQEGVAGWVFRLAFGVALAKSTHATLGYSWRKAREALDKGQQKALRVRLLERRCNADEHIARRRAENVVALAQVASYQEIELKRDELERGQQLGQLRQSYQVQPGGNGRSKSWGRASQVKVIQSGEK